MGAGTSLDVASDFQFLLGFLPAGWEEKAKELGALRRCRKVADAQSLLRVLLIHVGEGCSLRETALRAKRGGIADLSDVAIMGRLKRSGEWFRWMNVELMRKWVQRRPMAFCGGDWNVRLVDATRIKEPGPTGSSWCLHYCVDLASLCCTQMQVCDKHGNGETFRRFRVESGDLFIADRAYGVASGIHHVTQRGGQVVARFSWSNLPLWTQPERKFDLFEHLRGLEGGRLGDWPVCLKVGEEAVWGRVCAVKKSRQAARKARQRALRKAQKNAAKLRPETLEAAGYLFVFTTIERAELGPRGVLEFYRSRWQIELVFKRLKSLLGLGHLRKNDPQAAIAWIHGKLFVALLLEALLRHGESFFPWGYPLEPP